MSTKPSPNLLDFFRDTCLAPFDASARERLKSEPYFPNAEDVARYATEVHTETITELEAVAERRAYEICPEGCICPNNGGADCPWCEAKSIELDALEEGL